MSVALEAANYDNVCAYTSSKAQKRWKMLGHSVMAANRFKASLAALGGLPGQQGAKPQGAKGLLAAARQRAAAPQPDLPVVTEDELQQSLRRNSTLSSDDLRSRRPSDVSGSRGQLGWARAWYLNKDGQQLARSGKSVFPNRRDSQTGQSWVSQQELEEIGVVFIKVPLGNLQPVDKVVSERGYSTSDMLKAGGTDGGMAAEEAERWYREHFHRDEEMRFVVNGECYFDFRDKKDEWIRIHAVQNDLIVIPAGCCMRGTLIGESAKPVHLRRFYRTGGGQWAPVFRSDAGANADASRSKYVTSRRRGSVCEDNGFILESDKQG